MKDFDFKKATSDKENPHRLLLSRPSPTIDTPDQTYFSSVSQDDVEEPKLLLGLNPTASRPPMDQETFDMLYNYNNTLHKYKGNAFARHSKLFFHRYYSPFLSCDSLVKTIFGFIPILKWLPNYSFKDNLVNDIVGGLTVGVMHVPQGIAYAILAKVDPVVGLYTSFFAPLFYMIFGTSKHNSIGSFAVVSLMCGLTVEKIMDANTIEFSSHDLSTDSVLQYEYSDKNLTPTTIASTLAFTVGLIQLLMGILRLEVITTYFSDQIVGGFTTGASLHVAVAQLPALFGISKLPSRSGPANFFLKFYDVASNINRLHFPTVIISAASLLFLCIGKDYFNPFVKKRANLPTQVPFEIPMPQLPSWKLIPELLPSAIGISVVVLAIHISLGKIIGKKLNYKIDPGQELYALGLTSSLSAIFPVYPASCSLGRTLVNVEAGTKTQFSTIFSSILLISIILYVGKWLRTLPMCVLSAIILFALKGMFKKLEDLKTLWPLSKIDFAIWLVSFLSTVSWDVTEGLGVSIAFALLTTVFRTQWPHWHYLSNLSGTNDYRDSERYKEIVNYKGICIFRFDSPLLFTNIEQFKANVHSAYDEWFTNNLQLSSTTKSLNLNSEKDIENIGNVLTIATKNGANTIDFEGVHLYQHFVIDCSGFTFVDYMGVNALKEIFIEMKNRRVLVYFSSAKAPVLDLFEACGFYKFVPKTNFYPTINDAVSIARKMRKESLLCDKI